MGCDIHIVLERRRTGEAKWIGQWSSDNYNVVGRNLRVRMRDYGFFARAAGVKGPAKGSPQHYPKNLPRDVSDLAWDRYMEAPTDYHSPSHLSVDDFCAAWLVEHPNHPDVRAEHAAYDLLGIDSDDAKFEHRVVFWFDN